MARRTVIVGMVAAIGVTGCTRTVYRSAVEQQSPQAKICSGLSELDATFAAVPTIVKSTPPDQLMKLRDDITRSSEKVTSERGRYNETARSGLKGAREGFQLAIDHSGAATGAVGTASKNISDAYRDVKTSANAVRYSMDCSGVPT